MIIAKTRPHIETLKEHTDALLERYYILKKAYGSRIPDEKHWKLLYKAVLYHDFGKVNNDFQYKRHRDIKSNIFIEKSEFGHIPHNYLSPLFLPISKWSLTKVERRILIQAIAYHHERNTQPNEKILEKIYDEELRQHFKLLQQEMDVELPDEDQDAFRITRYLNQRKRVKELEEPDVYFLYVIIKGLLHRLDHAASAHVPIEIDTSLDISELTKTYMEKEFGSRKLRPLQQFTFKHQDKNLIIVAQTGMGKTEASLLWAGKTKTFFTLPIRVSLNALFNRVHYGMGYQNAGLLHGSSASHLDENGIEQWEIINDQSRNFANKLLFTTVDQILKFPFKYKGYEKMFATMTYSKVIIDEIQAYDPWMVAVIIRAIEMIHKIGGQFMIMTATLPQIYFDELKERHIIDENCLYKEFVDNDFIRHRIFIDKQSVLNSIDEISEQGKSKKVLVIVNTVDRAIELYEHLKGLDTKLLHSRFIQKDRAFLEKEIKRFAEEESHGIWITTQLVEASIDIDFDILHTELSTIDSLLQRFGRCYRKRQLDHEQPNIFIYTNDVSGSGSVYNEDILKLTESYLQDFHWKVINEQQKVDMVKRIYSKETLHNTTFYKTFKNAVQELKYIEDYQYSEAEAQKVLRKIDALRIIPREIYNNILYLLERLEVEQNSSKRSEIRREIEKHTISVPRRKYEPNLLDEIDFYQTSQDGRRYPLIQDIFVLDVPYEFCSNNLNGVGLVSQIDHDGGEFL